jgi:hypothetical protein
MTYVAMLSVKLFFGSICTGESGEALSPKHEAYSYEDNYKPFEVRAKAPNNVREGGDE